MRTLLQDIRYGFRVLGKSPSLTAIAVLTLTLGIGVNTAVFSISKTILFFPFPHVDSDRVVFINSENPSRSIDRSGVSLADYLDWQKRSTMLSAIGAEDTEGFNLSGPTEPVRVTGNRATPNMFEVIGVFPDRGRVFSPEESQPGADPVLIVSNDFWIEHLEADPSALGRPVTLNGVGHTLIGIMPEDFIYRTPLDFWVPLDMTDTTDRASRSLEITARLADGVTVEQAQAEMDVITTQLDEAYPETNAGWSAGVVTIAADVLADAGVFAVLMYGAVLFLLLIACVNVANLFLARMASRKDEIAVRGALGAGRLRIIRQLLSEALVVAFLGGTGGVIVALWGVSYLRAYFAASPTIAILGRGLTIDWTLFLFIGGLVIATTLFFGLLPAIHGSRADLNAALKQAGRSGSGGISRARMQRLLVGGEIAASVILLVSSGLLIQFWADSHDKDLGIDTPGLLVTEMSLPDYDYPEPRQHAEFYRSLLEDVNPLSGIAGAAVGTAVPVVGLSGNTNTSIAIEGQAVFEDEAVPSVLRLVVSPEYFDVAGIAVREGRTFAGQDSADSQPVAMISETAARTYWPDRSPVGQRLRVDAGEGPWLTIVGIAADIQNQFVASVPQSIVYRPLYQAPESEMVLLVRVLGEPEALAPTIRSVIRVADGNLPIDAIRPIEQDIRANQAGGNLVAGLVAGSGVIALFLAALGIYGVVSFSVAQRTHEMGLRMALGADRRSLYGLVLGEGAVIALIGLAFGLAGGYGVGLLMQTGIAGFRNPLDPPLFVAVSMILAMVCLLASLVPARRASTVDPMVALRID
jgi:putative ABC transport system permease protein